MKLSNKLILLGILLLILSPFVIMLLPEIKEDQETKTVDCYDNNNNVILGVTCEKNIFTPLEIFFQLITAFCIIGGISFPLFGMFIKFAGE